MPDRDNFTTQDLFEDRNMKQVLLCIFSLSRQCYWVEGYQGPCIGKPEMAKKGAPSKFGEIKTEGLWGKANGAHTAADGRPTGQSGESRIDATHTCRRNDMYRVVHIDATHTCRRNHRISIHAIIIHGSNPKARGLSTRRLARSEVMGG